MSLVRRLVSAVTIVALSATLLTACQSDNSPNNKKEDTQKDDVKITDDLSKKVVLSWMIPTQQGLAVKESKTVKYAMEKLNVEFEFTELPVSQHEEKKRLLLSSRNLPDIVSWVRGFEANSYGPDGAFVDLSTYLNELPNFKKKMDQILEKSPQSKYTVYNADNQIFMTPHLLVNPIPIFDFSYVKDEFDAVGVTQMDTWAQVREGLEKLKQKYPDMYPLGFRNHYGLQTPLNLFVISFTGAKASAINFIGYDYDKQEFSFALDIKGYKEAVEFFAGLYKDGLIHTEYTIMDEEMLKNRIAKGKIFMIADYIGGWTGVTHLNKATNYKLRPLPLPQADGMPKVIGQEIPEFDTSVGTCLNGALLKNTTKLARALSFLDTMYSDEIFDVQWHNPDVTEKNGEKWVYKDAVYDTEGDFMKMRDIYFPWSLAAIFQDACEERPAPDSAYYDYRENFLRNPQNKELYKPYPVVPLSINEQKRFNECVTAVQDRFNASIALFAEGQKPMSEWDAFVKELKDVGGSEMAKIYNDAYQKYLANK